MASLPLYDQLLHAIGATAQQQAELENELRLLHRSLAFPGAGMMLSGAVRGVNSLVDQCRAMVLFCAMPEGISTATEGALVAAATADQLRHRAVHDIWVDLGENATVAEPFVRLQLQKVKNEQSQRVNHELTATASDLSLVNNARDDLQAVTMRIAAARWYVEQHGTLQLSRDRPLSDSALARIIEMISGRQPGLT